MNFPHFLYFFRVINDIKNIVKQEVKYKSQKR